MLLNSTRFKGYCCATGMYSALRVIVEYHWDLKFYRLIFPHEDENKTHIVFISTSVFSLNVTCFIHLKN